MASGSHRTFRALLGHARVMAALPEGAIAAAMVAAIGWSLGPGCGTDAAGAGGSGGSGGAPVDYNGTTGSGDEMLNGDLTGEPDTADPSKPDCAPEALVDGSGNCVPSCFASGARCAEDDPTQCAGFPSVHAYDCTVCCAVPDGQPTCPPAGCADADCPPGEDCSYTATCPDGVCAPDESCSTCPIDCGECAPSCGDGICAAGRESCSTCPEDCGACAPGCGDGACATGSGPGAETCETCPEDCGSCLKVLTWDIDAGLRRGKGEVQATLRAIAAVIAAERPDYVGLQSVDQGTARSGKLDEALFIAQRVKMYKRFGGAFNYDGGQYGLAFLSRRPIVSMRKTTLDTSGEWAKRRIVLTATLDPPAYYTDFDLAVTQLARADAARLAQASSIAADLGTKADAILVGDLYEAPGGPAVQSLQAGMNLLDLWPMFGSGTGLTTAKSRFDYLVAGLNWWNQGAAGACAVAVRTYVKPAKGLSSHRPVVGLFQQGFMGIDCGTGADDGGDDGGAIGTGDTPCVDDEDCAEDPVFRFCVGGYCSECRGDDDCIDPGTPTCGATKTCR